MTADNDVRGMDGAAVVALSRDVILAKALELADAEGIENLSVRKLASSLNRTAMALYRYFDSMDDIKAGVLALAFTEVDVSAVPGERWDDTLRRTTESIRQMYLRHRRSHLYLLEGDAADPGLRDHTERVQKLHLDQGIPGDILMRTWRIVDAFLSGLRDHTERVQKLHLDQGIPGDILMRTWRIVDAFLSGFIVNEIREMEQSGVHHSPADQPAWFETTDGAYSEQAFRDGIEIIIAGVRGMAKPDPCEWYTPR